MDLCLVKVFKQVGFKFDSHLMKYSSSDWNLSYITKSELAMTLAMFEWQNLLDQHENLCSYSIPMVWDAVEISWELDKRYFGFGVDLVSYSAAVFNM